MMIDLHTHTLFSDGELLPYELIRRALSIGYKGIALTDHVDASNMDFIVPRILGAVKKIRGSVPIDILAGVELTHVPPAMIKELVAEARKLGAEIVLVHGETISEPVTPETNIAGIEAGADIITHPGLITDEEVLLARDMGVALEITARKGHCLSNGHVARLALKHGAKMVLNTDSHGPSDLITLDTAKKILLSAGIDELNIGKVFLNSREIIDTAIRRGNAKGN